MDCSLPGSSVHGILQAGILQWAAFLSPGDLPSPGTERGSSARQADSLPIKPPGKPQQIQTTVYKPNKDLLYSTKNHIESLT